MSLKYLHISCLTVLFVLLAGCVSVDYSIEIDEDDRKHGKIVAQIDKVMEMAEVEDFILENFYKNMFLEDRYRANHHSYDLYETDDYYFFELEAAPHSYNHFGDFALFSSESIATRTLPFWHRYRNHATLYIPDEAIEGYVDQSFFSEDVKELNLHITTPNKVREHNSDYISDDGRTMTWEINPHSNNDIQFTYIKNNLYIPLLLVGLLMGVLLIRKKVKAKNEIPKIPRK